MLNSLELKNFFSPFVPEEETLLPNSPQFATHSTPWSASYDRNPSIILVPSTLETLQRVVGCLHDSDIDFAVRGRGCGNSSASDVVVSMRSFDSILFDQASETVLIGAGLSWGEVDERLATLAPGYVVVGARCPYVGVAGSTLSGGLSWLSHELGLASDPQNLLDVQMVITDGRVVWASEDPELLWALRGGGGNFGVATALRLRAHKRTAPIFSGTIVYPSSALATISGRLSKWTAQCEDPKMAMHVFVVDSPGRALHNSCTNEAQEPQLISLIFDAHGEQHGRSEEGFKWAIDIDGALETDAGGSCLKEMSLAQVHDLQRASEATQGACRSWYQAALVSRIDEDFLIRAWRWYHHVTRLEEAKWSSGTFVLLEIMQEPALTSAPSPSSTAWPHGLKGRQHVLQLGIAADTGAESRPSQTDLDTLRHRALQILQDAPAQISGVSPHPPEDFLPNFLLPIHDVEQIFGGKRANWKRLRKVKTAYDRRGRFNKGLFIPPLEAP